MGWVERGCVPAVRAGVRADPTRRPRLTRPHDSTQNAGPAAPAVAAAVSVVAGPDGGGGHERECGGGGPAEAHEPLHGGERRAADRAGDGPERGTYVDGCVVVLLGGRSTKGTQIPPGHRLWLAPLPIQPTHTTPHHRSSLGRTWPLGACFGAPLASASCSAGTASSTRRSASRCELD